MCFRVLYVIAALAAVLLLVACGNDEPVDPAEPEDDEARAETDVVDDDQAEPVEHGIQSGMVTIESRSIGGRNFYEPAGVHVEPGTTIRFENHSGGHSATAYHPDNGEVQRISDGAEAWDFPLMGGDTHEITLDEEGVYDYFCRPHQSGGHVGRIVVGEVDAAGPDYDDDIPTAAADNLPTVERITALGIVGEETPDERIADEPPTSEELPVRSHGDAIETLPYEIDEDGVKNLELSIEEVMWDYGDGEPVRSWGYEGQLPGPEIRVTEGDEVRITVTNELPEATTVHWHGIDLVNEADGVPGYTQDPIEPGESFVYEFTAEPAGTRFYHSHGEDHASEAEQVDRGLAGPFIVEPEGYEAPDVEHTIVLSERIAQGLFPMNGRVYPETEAVEVSEGDRVRIRMINAGSSTFHPMHLHGHQFQVTHSDGNPIPEAGQMRKNVQTVMPGETWDIQFDADNPGDWLFHCHELSHVGGGMATAVIYEK